VISGYLNHQGNIDGKSGEVLGSIIAYSGLFICLIITPILLYRILRLPLSTYQTNDFKEKWGVIHEDIRTDSKFASAYFVVFVSRRLIFMAISFYLI
jgi:hypothetical protein